MFDDLDDTAPTTPSQATLDEVVARGRTLRRRRRQAILSAAGAAVLGVAAVSLPLAGGGTRDSLEVPPFLRPSASPAATPSITMTLKPTPTPTPPTAPIPPPATLVPEVSPPPAVPPPMLDPPAVEPPRDLGPVDPPTLEPPAPFSELPQVVPPAEPGAPLPPVPQPSPPPAPARPECGQVGGAADSDEVATGIVATGVGCPTARAVAQALFALGTGLGYTAEGFTCRGTEVPNALVTYDFRCTRPGGAVITFTAS